MDVVVSLYRNAKDPTERGQYSALLMVYLDFSLGNQVTPNRRSAPGRGLGEPKFFVTGAPLKGTGDDRRTMGRPCGRSPSSGSLICFERPHRSAAREDEA